MFVMDDLLVESACHGTHGTHDVTSDLEKSETKHQREDQKRQNNI